MVQWDQRALTGHPVAQRRRVRAPDQLRPESMHGLRERLDERVHDAVEERRALVEVRERERLELEALPAEVGVDEVHDLALGDVRGVVPRAGDERVEVAEHGR